MAYGLLLHVLSLLTCTIFGEYIKFDSVKRDVHLNSHKVVVNCLINAKNYGRSPEPNLDFVFKTETCSSIYFIKVTQNNQDLPLKRISTSDTTHFCYYRVTLENPLSQNQSAELTLNVIFSRRFFAYPETVPQNVEQSFLFHDDFYIDSLYDVLRQTSIFHIDKNFVISTTQDAAIQQNKKTIIVGPLNSVPPFSSKKLYIHFRYPHSIFIIDEMVSTYQVSEWGAINVWNDFWVHNEAAPLKEGYSRLKDNRPDPRSVYQWEMEIPPNTYNIYYRDALGNISTSSVQYLGDMKKLILEPRFPIFGGWKTYYYVAYTMTLNNFLFRSSDNPNKRTLVFDILGSPMQDYIVDKAVIRVLLPEGATSVKLGHTAVRFASVEYAVKHSYLDFYGRPTVEIVLDKACSEKNVEIEISYEFDSKLLFRKPLLLCVSFFVIMSSMYLIFSIRFPVLITVEAERECALESTVEEIESQTATFSSLCDSYLTCVKDFKIHKNIDVLQKKLQKICTDMDRVSHKISFKFNVLKNMDAKYSSQASDYSLKIKELTSSLSQYEDYSKKVVNEAMTRDEYVHVSTPLENKIHTSVETLENIGQSLLMSK